MKLKRMASVGKKLILNTPQKAGWTTVKGTNIGPTVSRPKPQLLLRAPFFLCYDENVKVQSKKEKRSCLKCRCSCTYKALFWLPWTGPVVHRLLSNQHGSMEAERLPGMWWHPPYLWGGMFAGAFGELGLDLNTDGKRLFTSCSAHTFINTTVNPPIPYTEYNNN